jgi:hypothetical protein
MHRRQRIKIKNELCLVMDPGGLATIITPQETTPQFISNNPQNSTMPKLLRTGGY